MTRHLLQVGLGLAAGFVSLGIAACSQTTDLSSSAPSDAPPSTNLTPQPSPTPAVTPPAPTPADIAAAAQYRQLGLDLRNQGQLDRAIVAFQQGVTLDPSNSNGHLILGWTLHLADRPDAAIDALEAALTNDANFVPALNALGIVYLVNGQLEAAKYTHLQAIELHPNNEIAQYNLSLTFQRLGDFDRAVTHAQRATELEPNNPHPWVALAIALRSNRQSNAANQAFARAVQLDARYGNSVYLNHLAQAGFSPAQIQLSDRVRMGQ